MKETRFYWAAIFGSLTGLVFQSYQYSQVWSGLVKADPWSCEQAAVSEVLESKRISDIISKDFLNEAGESKQRHLLDR